MIQKMPNIKIRLITVRIPENILDIYAAEAHGMLVIKHFPRRVYTGYPGECGMPSVVIAVENSPLSSGPIEGDAV